MSVMKTFCAGVAAISIGLCTAQVGKSFENKTVESVGYITIGWGAADILKAGFFAVWQRRED